SFSDCSLPPTIVAPLLRFTVPPLARIVPWVLPTALIYVPLSKASVPPAVASISPVLVTPALDDAVGFMTSEFGWLALIVPRLVLFRIIRPSPIFTAAEMLMLLVSTSVPLWVCPKIKLLALVDRVSVPVPLSVTLPLIWISV